MLEQFIAECQKIDSRLQLTTAYGHMAVAIDDDTQVIAGYNFPWQAKLITGLMERNGSFR